MAAHRRAPADRAAGRVLLPGDSGGLSATPGCCQPGDARLVPVGSAPSWGRCLDATSGVAGIPRSPARPAPTAHRARKAVERAGSPRDAVGARLAGDREEPGDVASR